MKKYKATPLHGCILKLLHKYCTVIVEVTYKIQTLFKTRKQQHGGWKKEVTVRFYGKWCLPVITWYKKHSLKQVLPTTYKLDKTFFAATTFKDLWVDPSEAD